MIIDHVTLAEAFAKALGSDKSIANVTAIQEVGQRNPRAGFTVVSNNGAVLQVEVKRLMKGQDVEPEPAKPKPRARKPAAKKGAKK